MHLRMEIKRCFIKATQTDLSQNVVRAHGFNSSLMRVESINNPGGSYGRTAPARSKA
jgi:hypothetical protein